jgi:hypothetical protein
MRYRVTTTLLLPLVLSGPQSQAGEPSLGERLEKLVPRAAGVAQVDVVSVKDIDSRPRDGPLSTDVRLRILRGTGATSTYIAIIKARGGLQPRNSPPFKPHGPVKFDSFKMGERYWVAFASPYDYERCPQGVVQFWLEKDAPKMLEEAVRADHYVGRPFYHPDSGLTHSYPPAKDTKSWQVRMERDGKRLWEVDLPGERYRGTYFREWLFLNLSQLPGDLGYDKESRAGVFLYADTTSVLEEGNRYRLDAGKYKLRYALMADNGKIASISMFRFEKSDASVNHYFDLKTEKLVREERYDWLEKGGLAVGATAEGWLRKVVRNFDAHTGKLHAEAIFYCVESTFYPVKKQ